MTVGGGPPKRLPFRSGGVPPVVRDFQPRSVPELESLVSGGVVLSGLGGVGKTQAAAEYARRQWSVDLVGWVTASTQTSVVSGLAALGRVVSDAGDDEDAARQFLTWCTTHSWLVVFDDVADPGELAGLWPQGPDGRLVVTTRRNEPWALASDTSELAQVGVFTASESHAYLRGVLGEVEGIPELAALLGYLPLAISQAAAYVKRTPGMDCFKYAAKWQRSSLTKMFPAWAGVDGRRDTVATTWGISIEAADLLEPAGLARPMLAVMSLLDPNGIPLSVLTSEPVLDYLSSGCSQEVEEDDAAEALANLSRLNLIAFDADQVYVHSLVQKVTRDQLSGDRLPVLSHVAADALRRAWPEVERDTALGAMLRFNAGVLAGHAGAHLWHPDCHSMLFRAGTSLGEAGQVHAAVTYHHAFLASANRHLGPDHPDTLRTRSNLAHWTGHNGDAAAAKQAYTQLLEDQLRTLGPDHPNTLITRNNLAHWTGETGEPSTAAQEYTQLLADRIRILGPDHPDTLRTRSNLAHWTGETGDAAAAKQAYTQLLEDQLRTLGPDHPNTLITRNNLARWTGQTGDAAAAKQAYTQLLEDQLRTLGPDHPDTLTTRNNLAHSTGETGEPSTAAQEYTQLLADRIRILGPDHPDTLRTRSNLAEWIGEAGEPAAAAHAHAELLVDTIRVLGVDHPDTEMTRKAIARWRQKAGLGDTEEAEDRSAAADSGNHDQPE
ncbi:hypothetical protein JOD54_001833 [Actinokineospora baliensis]|uniref:FxSxx-COOH system tetratricopeptide repeat protein n=1 Tax=Actinokineospora baliensis TaxID=547056 RepID=UPI00195B4129|nr:FxSxx-COOH system tetratricopeptide repeat protein [Actinokineospora baliensis]MBM7771629.1 hypothetical protein [Actinokineospora baliensis]